MVGFNKSAILILVLCSMVFASCNKTDEDAVAEKAKITKYATDNGYTKLPSGVYIKFFTDTTSSGQLTPSRGQTLIIDYTGRYLDGNLLETTNEELGSSNFPDLYFVYGPFRTRKGYTKRGLDTALYYFNIGDSASVLIPSDWWNHDYTPVVYNVKLLDTIFNDTAHAEIQFNEFVYNNGFSLKKDTFWYAIPYKVISSPNAGLDKTPYPFKIGDVAKIRLTARFAEDYNGNGRIFYPLCNASQDLDRIYGDDIAFPFLQEVDTAIKHMNKGDKLEIVVPFNFAFGTAGFNNPVYGVTIVPSFMPVHYSIELLDIIPGE
jgi:FKBP-type peptidyl-prolyl cis-trans isomerase 2